MKIGTLISIMFAAILVIALFGSIVEDFRSAYPDVSINQSILNQYEQYSDGGNATINNQSMSFVDKMQEHFYLVKANLKLMSSDSYITKIAGGLLMPLSTIGSILLIIWDSLVYGNKMLTTILYTTFHLPPAIIYLIETFFIIYILFCIIAWIKGNKSPV